MHGSFEQPGDGEERHDEASDTAAQHEPVRLAWPLAVCDRLEPLLESFHDAALGAADERFVREHVANCARCTARLRRYDEIDSVLRVAPAPRVGPQLRAQLYTRIAATQQRRGIFAALQALRTKVGDQAARERTNYPPFDARPAESRRALGASRPGLVTNWINGVAAIAVVALLALLFNTLTGMPYRAGTSNQSTLSRQAITTLAGLPRFSGYRAAYLDFEGRLHFVSTDGKASAGPLLPNAGLLMRTPAAPYYDVAVSQDGYYLAYVEGDASVSDATTPLPDGGPVAVANLETGKTLRMPVMANDLSWSPDNRFLAAPNITDSTNINIIDALAGTSRQLAVSFEGTRASVPLIAGWIDTMHIAVFYQIGATPGSTATPSVTPTEQASNATQSIAPVQQSLGSMDIRSGIVSYLTTLPNLSDVFLSPDGQEILLAPNYSTATASVVDTRTGETHALPGISKAFAGKFANLGGGNWSLHSAWQPGAGHVLALSLSIGSASSSQQPGVWLLDLDNDSATPLGGTTYPLAWFPQMPQALVTADPPQGTYPENGAGVGPKLYAFAPVVQGGAALPVGSSMVAFLGLVRTAR